MKGSVYKNQLKEGGCDCEGCSNVKGRLLQSPLSHFVMGANFRLLCQTGLLIVDVDHAHF